ncbi:hypothetical protein GCM10027346_20960 [Hymenobacter seoulensis]
MVRALLAGTKTQTRRIMKPQPTDFVSELDQSRTGVPIVSCGPIREPGLPDLFHGKEVKCPYGQPGDRLWVREGFRYVITNAGTCDARYDVQYAADDAFAGLGAMHPAWLENAVARNTWKGIGTSLEFQGWKPSIHIPRKASRILLEIVSVRVERLQDISHEDAVAEGIEQTEAWGGDWTWYQDYTDDSNQLLARDSYRSLWAKINGPESWKANPWVWVVEFKRVTDAN